MSQRIDMVLFPDGRVSVKTSGFVGPECKAATAEIERDLGQEVETKREPEYYAQRKNTQTVKGSN